MKKWYEGDGSEDKNTRAWNRIKQDICPLIFIGPDPCSSPFTKEEADSFDIILNVGDNLYTFEQGPSREGQQVYWYPLVETGKWHWSTLFPIFHILDAAILSGKKVYVHCAAGAYRSPGVVDLWHQSLGFEATSPKRYVENHIGPEFHTFCERWRNLQKEGKQYSLMSILMQYKPKIGVADDQLYFGQYKKDHEEFHKRRGTLNV